MEQKVNELSPIEHEIEIKIDYQEILPDIEKALKEEHKKISLPGFRKGKVPMQMFKKLYGEAVEYQASEKIANKIFWEAVDSADSKPVNTPQMTDLDYKPNEYLSFKVRYEVKPKLTLKDYKELEIEKPLFEVKEEDIEKDLDNLLKAHASYEEAEIVEEKSKIVVDLQRLDDSGQPVEGNRSENMTIDLSDERVNKEIADNSIGKKTGDRFNFNFIDEHKHGEEVHRQEMNYEVEIKKIEKIIYPEITEELVEKISGKRAKTIDEFKTMIRANYEKYLREQSENIFTNSLLNRIVENNNFDPPRGFVDSLLERFVEAEKENAKRQKQQVDEKAAREYLKPRAEWTAKWQIIMETLAQTEKIQVEESELENLAKAESEKTGISVDKLLNYYKSTNRNEALLEDKVVKFLVENNKAVEYHPDKKKKESKGKKK